MSPEETNNDNSTEIGTLEFDTRSAVPIFGLLMISCAFFIAFVTKNSVLICLISLIVFSVVMVFTQIALVKCGRRGFIAREDEGCSFELSNLANGFRKVNEDN